jgi:hypothetical protein
MKAPGFPLAIVSSLVVCIGCAPLPPDKTSEVREQKFYRTGSNIAVKDYAAENIEVHSGGDIVNPVNRPMGSVLGKKPGN